ncbi:MAG: putative toxin-antitoxin system toxin component, PIN family [Phycisphaerales bacterium]|nr:putative toxin-antitoxin system toxin component, PIN family [Phycisphaerales bacterium]
MDTNILLQGMINEASPAGRIVIACEQRIFIPLLSSLVLEEYRYILTHPHVMARYPHLQPKRIASLLARLMFIGDTIDGKMPRFRFPRDPRDEKFIELAIAGSATHLVTTDRDLLDLPSGRTDASKRFRRRLPNIQVMDPFTASRYLNLNPD